MEKILFETYKDYFRVGAAVSGVIFNDDFRVKIEKKIGKKINCEKDTALLKKHFNLIVAENDTKMERIYKAENDFDFSAADKFIKFGKENNKDIRWHTLVWHNQSPKWIFKGEKDSQATKEQLEERTKKYIYTVGERYKDDICSVDVVNECISDKSFCIRTKDDHSMWREIMGEDYIEKAFFWAKDAFPKSDLVINDYNLEIIPQKRQAMYELLKKLLAKKVPVNTVGLQMHISMYNPPVEEIEKTIELFGSLGLKVIITEMDVSIYNFEDQSTKPITAELLEEQGQRFFELFECFKKEAKKGYLQDVLLWGITDAFSWKNNFPVPNRPDAALLFDVKGEPKPAFIRINQ